MKIKRADQILPEVYGTTLNGRSQSNIWHQNQIYYIDFFQLFMDIIMVI